MNYFMKCYMPINTKMKRIIHLAVMTLNDYLDDKGYLHEGMDQELVNSFVEFNIVEAFKRTIEYKDYKYDSNRDIQSNFANLREITKNC